jgi:hypothetical protein
MGIGVIGVLAGAAASPFKTGAEVFSINSDDFYEEVTQTIPAGKYYISFRANSAPNGRVTGWLRDSAGRDYALRNGENLITFPETITSFVVSTAFWRIDLNYGDPTVMSISSGTASWGFYGTPMRKYNGLIVRGSNFSHGSNVQGTAVSADGLTWTRFTPNGDGNANQYRSEPTMNNKGYIGVRPRLNSVSRIYSTPNQETTSPTYTNISNGNNRRMMDSIDLSDGSGPGGYWILMEAGEVWYSADATSWSLFANLSSKNPQAFFLENNKLFLLTAAQNNGEITVINSSTPGDYTDYYIGVNHRASSIAWDGTRYVASMYNTLPYHSTDLSTWTQVSFDAGVPTQRPDYNDAFLKWIPNSNEWLWVARYNVYRSADGQTWEVHPDPAWTAERPYQLHGSSIEGVARGIGFSDSRMPEVHMTREQTAPADRPGTAGLRQPGFAVTALELID